MNFNFAVSAEIDAKTIEDMIKMVVEEQTGRKVASISFKHTEVGDCMDRYTTTVFNGVTVYFVKETMKAKPLSFRSDLGSQIDAVESDRRPYGDH